MEVVLKDKWSDKAQLGLCQLVQLILCNEQKLQQISYLKLSNA
jgi:hypothetical protein